MPSLTFGASKEMVVVWRDGIPFAAHHWQFALDLGYAYQEAGLAAQRNEEFRREVSFGGEYRTAITQDGRTLILSNGIVIADFDGPTAVEIGNMLIAAARRAEEYTEHERVIADQALMMRLTGGQISLSGNRDINSEAWKEAETNPTLTKNIEAPKSIKSKESFGYPTLIREPLKTANEIVSATEENVKRALRKLLN